MRTDPTEPLAGRCIALAEGRALDIFAGLLERRGARILRYPLLRIIDAPDPAAVLGWAHRLAAGGLDDVILLTGEGLNRILACIERHDPALRGHFLTALAAVRKITRGPKPARALRDVGLNTDLPAVAPTSAGIIQTLRSEPLEGRRIGVQLYGEDPNEALVDHLRSRGAQVHTVAPYRYADAVSDTAIDELLERMRTGEVDAIAFTSRAQVERLFRGREPSAVCRALAASNVAAVGPLVAAALAAHGVAVQTVPQHAWFMKPLTAALVSTLTDAPEAGPDAEQQSQEDSRSQDR